MEDYHFDPMLEEVQLTKGKRYLQHPAILGNVTPEKRYQILMSLQKLLNHPIHVCIINRDKAGGGIQTMINRGVVDMEAFEAGPDFDASRRMILETTKFIADPSKQKMVSIIEFAGGNPNRVNLFSRFCLLNIKVGPPNREKVRSKYLVSCHIVGDASHYELDKLNLEEEEEEEKEDGSETESEQEVSALVQLSAKPGSSSPVAKKKVRLSEPVVLSPKKTDPSPPPPLSESKNDEKEQLDIAKQIEILENKLKELRKMETEQVVTKETKKFEAKCQLELNKKLHDILSDLSQKYILCKGTRVQLDPKQLYQHMLQTAVNQVCSNQDMEHSQLLQEEE
jgi:hypothetical protein